MPDPRPERLPRPDGGEPMTRNMLCGFVFYVELYVIGALVYGLVIA